MKIASKTFDNFIYFYKFYIFSEDIKLPETLCLLNN